jgi:hypothetical protein
MYDSISNRRWGFASNEALSQGQTGIACRGEEHDVTMVWSLTSGKRQITVDGQEVHYSSNRAGIVDFSWTMRGNHILKVVAHANPPLSATPNFRQYDFFVDGQSFFDMPKVYELGLRGAPQAQSRVPGISFSYGDATRGSPLSNDDPDLQRAIQESLAESRRHLQNVNRSDDNYSVSGTSAGPDYLAHAPSREESAPRMDLLDFGSPTPHEPAALVPAAPQYAAPAPAYGQPAPAYGYSPAPPPALPPAPLPALTYEQAPAYAPAPPMYTAPSTPHSVAAPPQYQLFPSGQLLSPGVTSAASAPPSYGFPVQQPVFAQDDPFAPKPPTQNELLTSVLGLYGSQPTSPTTPGAPPQPNFQSPQTPTSTSNGQINLTMNAPLTITNEQEDAPKSAFDKALSTLVNFDDISAPADKDIQEAMRKKQEEQTRKGSKSKALPPAANNMVGSGATLAQISQVKQVRIQLCRLQSMLNPFLMLFIIRRLHHRRILRKS